MASRMAGKANKAAVPKLKCKREPTKVIYQREANLHRDVICDKNPGHRSFICVHNFTEDHFPGGCRDGWRRDYVMAACDLTVHLMTLTVSSNRPRFYPNSDDPFPFFTPGGGFFPHQGTGFVSGVYSSTDEKYRNEGKFCRCPECLSLSIEERFSDPLFSERYLGGEPLFWIIEVVTAAHVTFDLSEVVNTDVKYFYDHKDSKTYTSRGFKCLDQSAEGDRCRFICFTHEAAVAERLRKALEKCMDIRNTYCQSAPAGPVVIISHPHGLAKHITVGRRTNKDYASLYYTADTCEGSSGAVVIFRRKGWVEEKLFNFTLYPHSGACSDGTNMSGRIMHWLW